MDISKLWMKEIEELAPDQKAEDDSEQLLLSSTYTSGGQKGKS